MYGATLAGGVPVGHAADMRRSDLHEAGGDGCPAEVKVPALAQNECRLTFSGYEGKETLRNFPALIKIPDGLTGFDYRDSTVDGSDIAFFGADGKQLAHEIDPDVKVGAVCGCSFSYPATCDPNDVMGNYKFSSLSKA